jgi:hypothetical protein
MGFPEERFAGRLGDGDNGRVPEPALGADRVESLASVLDGTDELDVMVNCVKCNCGTPPRS